jgi:hypothetical protein
MFDARKYDASALCQWLDNMISESMMLGQASGQMFISVRTLVTAATLQIIRSCGPFQASDTGHGSIGLRLTRKWCNKDSSHCAIYGSGGLSRQKNCNST